METAVYDGRAVIVLAVRPCEDGEVIALVCEDSEELHAYERLFRAGAPYKLDYCTPLGNKLKKHHPNIIVEVLEPLISDAGWPWIVAFYSPKRIPDGQRGHWVFEVAGDRAEAEAIVGEIQQSLARR